MRSKFSTRWPIRLAPLALLAAALLPARPAAAGPPFITDDPEPVDYHHWEVYFASIYANGRGGAEGTAPHVEINNGVAPNVQLHVILPVAFSAPTGGPLSFGYGDTELGVKYRFVQETKDRPMVGIFPLVEVPSGDESRGLGTGHTPVFLPVWIQKSWGPWTSYGGGGRWFNPGAGNRDYWLVGGLVQRELSKHLTLGGEVYHTTSAAVGEASQTNFNVGGQYNFDEGHHLLFSAGRSISGDTRFQSYVAYQLTFGPKEKEGKDEEAGKLKGGVGKDAAPHK